MQPIRTLLLGAALLGACALPPAQAQTPSLDSPNRKELKRYEFPEAPGLEMVASITEYQPGDTLPRHIHHGTESGYVVQGTMIQLPGKEPTMFATGTPILNLRDVAHAGFKIVGPGSLKLYTVHIVDKGKPLYDAAK